MVDLPTKFPARVHSTIGVNWTGELRAVVDDQLVIRIYSRRKGWRYKVESRWWWDQGHIKKGPLPKDRTAGHNSPDRIKEIAKC